MPPNEATEDIMLKSDKELKRYKMEHLLTADEKEYEDEVLKK